MVFFGMGDGLDFDGSEDDGEALGDDGGACFRGMEAYTVVASSGFESVSPSDSTAAVGSGSVLMATGGLSFDFKAATIDLVTRVGVAAVGSGGSSVLISSSLSANKSSSSSEGSGEAVASLSSVDMLESLTTL